MKLKLRLLLALVVVVVMSAAVCAGWTWDGVAQAKPPIQTMPCCAGGGSRPDCNVLTYLWKWYGNGHEYTCVLIWPNYIWVITG